MLGEQTNHQYLIAVYRCTLDFLHIKNSVIYFYPSDFLNVYGLTFLAFNAAIGSVENS